MNKKTTKHSPLPSKAEVLQFINESAQRVGKREIARAFGLRGDDRQALKTILRELADDGHIERRHRRVAPPGRLPPITVIEVTNLDDDGNLRARPVTWWEDAPPPGIIVSQDPKVKPALGPGDRLLARLTPDVDGYVARAIRRLASAPDRVIGVLSQAADEWRLTPTNRRQKFDFRIAKGDLGGAEKDDLVAVEIIPGRRIGLREARVVERLGRIGEARSLSLIAIAERDIPVAFPPDARKEAEACEPVGLGDRTDLRAIPLVTIDGDDARDFDDAVWAQRDGDGWEIVVAIADVAHYVRSGNALDRAARERGNSVYFPDRVVPMLPEELSNELCSLKGGEERPVLAVHLWLDSHGNKRRHKFVRALMKSAGRLSYTQVQAAFDGAADAQTKALVEPVISALYGAYAALLEARGRREPLDLDLPENSISLDEHGRVTLVHPRERLDSHRLIEEFMIAANVAAAEELERLRQPCMYRIHDEPNREKLRTLRDFLRSNGFSLSLGEVIRPTLFNRALAKAADTPKQDIVNEAVLRAQSQARYAPDNIGHFGLSLSRYAHFTSPIRRYADLLVHRALILGLKLGGGGLSEEEAARFAETGEHISNCERRAMFAERDAMDRYIASYMAERTGSEFEARISSATRAGLFINIDGTGASGLIPISTLGSEYFALDEATQALIGERSGRRLTVGDRIDVRLMEATPLTGGLIFHLLGEDVVEDAPRRGPRKGGGRRGGGVKRTRR